MLPYVTILGRTLPSYGMLGMGALLLGLLIALVRCPRFGLSRDDCAYLYILGAIGALVGAKVLYLLPRISELSADFPLLWEQPEVFAARYLSGGRVVYGGFLGGVLGAWLAARYFKLRLSDFFPVLIPALPLIHAVGRVGCFCAGCCYGMPVSWGVVFPAGGAAPAGVPLLPVQLWEAGAEGVIFLFLLWYSRRVSRPAVLLRAYVFAYAPVRFVLEFLRGDAARGNLGPLSTSQWIGLAALCACLIWQMLERRECGRDRA